MSLSTPMLALEKVPGATGVTAVSGLGIDYPLMIVAPRDFADHHPEAVRAVIAERGTRSPE